MVLQQHYMVLQQRCLVLQQRCMVLQQNLHETIPRDWRTGFKATLKLTGE